MSEVRRGEPASVLRETDDEARTLAKSLVRAARFAALATIEKESGHPFASLVSMATDIDGAPLILVSRLSGHTANLAADPRCSLLLGQPGKGDPLAHPRLTLIGEARRVARIGADGARIRRRFLARNPKASLYVDFPDFSFLRIAPLRASLNGGFGKAYELTAADMLTDLGDAADFAALEEGAVAHMNDDHAEAMRLYATRLLKLEEGPWRCVGIDPEGLDLASGDLSGRVTFPERVTNGGALRSVLKTLADKARAGD